MLFKHINVPKFDELKSESINSQRWYTTPAGGKYASVTTILGHKEKPYLKEWQLSLGIEKAKKETKRCCDRGEAVHSMAEKYLNNDENHKVGYHPSDVAMFNQLRLKLNKINNIRVQEIPLFSDVLKIAGRVDCIGEMDGVLSIIDFKTSNGIKTDEMVHDYKLQCTMYSLCWYEMFGEFIEDFAILIAVERGCAPLVFKGKVKDYIPEVNERINTFYKSMEMK